MNPGARRVSYLLMSLAIFVALLLPAIFSRKAFATGQIYARSLTLQAGATDGGSKASGVVNHFFSFTVPTNASVGSILFQYCTVAVGSCSTPVGLDTTASTLGTQT